MNPIMLVVAGIVVGIVSAIATFASGSGLIAALFAYMLGGIFGVGVVVVIYLVLDLFARARPNNGNVAYREGH